MTQVIPDTFKTQAFSDWVSLFCTMLFRHSEGELDAGAHSGPKPLDWREYMWNFREQPTLDLLPTH